MFLVLSTPRKAFVDQFRYVGNRARYEFIAFVTCGAIGTLRYPGRGGKENEGLPEKAWSEDAANLAGETN